MLKITPMQGSDTVTRLQIEGHILHQTVGELRAACEARLADHHTLLLEVSGIRFADAAGIDLFHDLRQRDVVLVGCSGFLRELLHQDRAEDRVRPEQTRGDDAVRETQLLERLRRGEDEAFATLVRQYGSRLLAVARHLLGNEHDAQDVLQEAFLSAFKAIDQFTGNAKLSTWLHRIVVNAALMKLRSRRRRPEESIEELLPHFDGQGEWASGVTPWKASSEVLLQRQETRALVRQCIDRLPETYRTILMLRDIEELDTEEVASTLGITANAVKIRLHRARQALRALLEKELATPRSHCSPSL